MAKRKPIKKEKEVQEEKEYNGLKVSQSKVKTWRMCRMSYHLKYVEKIRRRRKSRPLQFGTMVHEVLEAEANGDDPFEMLDAINFDNEKMFTAEKEVYGEIVEDIRTIMTEYFEYHDDNKGIKFIRKNGRNAEHEFNLEIDDGIMMTGKIDFLARTPNKLRWLGEHKTFTNMPQDDDRWRNYQGVVYTRAIDIMGWPSVDGIMWDYVRSKPPSTPKFLKDGSLSKARCDTLPTVVHRVIKDHKLKKAEYGDLLKRAEENRENYFKRIFTPVNPNTVDYIFDMFLNTAREIAEDHGKRKEMNIGKHCGWCDYEPVCRALMTGSDAEYVKEREYYDAENDKKKK